MTKLQYHSPALFILVALLATGSSCTPQKNEEGKYQEKTLLLINKEIPDDLGKYKVLENIYATKLVRKKFPFDLLADKARIKRFSISSSAIVSFDAAGFTGVDTLVLDINQVTSLSGFGDQHGVRYINMANNELESLNGSGISQLRQLAYIDLSGNQLASFPGQIAGIGQLEHLDLSYNKISALPEDFQDMAQLAYLNLQGNDIRSIGEGIRQLGNLKKLVVGGNPLTEENIAQLKAWLPNTVVDTQP